MIIEKEILTSKPTMRFVADESLERIADAMESIAASLEKMANPAKIVSPEVQTPITEYKPGDVAWVCTK